MSALGLTPQLRPLGNALSAIAMLIALVLAWRVVSNGMNALQGGGLAAFWVRPPASAATATPEESEAAWRAQLAQLSR